MKIYYLNSSHWDREWYVPFQSFRFNLVSVLNRLIDIMEADPQYKLFCTDGQTIVLDDYAEIEPKRAKRLQKLIEEGRIVAGPWYVQPDELIVSGESLIRNLMIGHRKAEEWGGKPWKYGYGNDIFGHIAQMPQIYAGFGISGSAMSRGMGITDFDHFIWKSPDGTECFATVGPYDYLINKMRNNPKEQWKPYFKDFIDTAISRSKAPVVYMSCTADHAYPEAGTPYMHQFVREMYPDAELCDVTLDQMAEELKKYKEVLPVAEGELIQVNEFADYGVPAYNLTLVTSCYSSYYTLKSMNDRCQNLLEKQTEPMVAMSNIFGKEISHNFVRVAYQHLIQNHPHDSICGCSNDQVHKDMEFRFDQAEGISKRLRERFLEFENDVFRNADDACEYQLKLYNLQTYDRDGYVCAEISFYPGYKARQNGYYNQQFNNFIIVDAEGKEIPYQILSVQPAVQKRVFYEKKHGENNDFFDVYTVALKAPIPAMGYTALKVLPAQKKVAYEEYLPYGSNWAENDLIRLEILADGRLTITDKKTGVVYQGLNELEDNAEYGDGWVHREPLSDMVVSGIGGRTTISRISAGLAQVSFEIDKELMIPEHLDGIKLTRSEQKKPLHIRYTVTLKADSAAVFVDMDVENDVKDHRLRVQFPTKIKGDSYFAGQAFCRVERKTGYDRHTKSWVEPDRTEKPINGIIGKQDAKGNGLAFVAAQGIHEGAWYDDQNDTLAVTLFRVFDRVRLQPGAIRSQLQQKLSFRYAIVPMSQETSYADLLRIQDEVADTELFLSKRVMEGEPAVYSDSLLKVEGKDIVTSIFKCAEEEDGYVLRIFNASGQETCGELSVNFNTTDICIANMNEEIMEKACFESTESGSVVSVQLRPWEIRTYKFKV